MSNSNCDQPSDTMSNKIIAILFSALFILLGIFAFFWFITSVSNNTAIQTVLHSTPVVGDPPPSIVLAFLTEFGIVLPLLVICLGLASIWLGIQLRTQSVSAANWASAALRWIAILLSGIFLVNLGRYLLRIFFPPENQPTSPENALVNLIVLVVVVFFFIGIQWLLQKNIEKAFIGKERLNAQEIRSAWNLLIPTLIVFVFVAARPLEQTFIRSVTDKRFARQEIPNYVGLENYKNLLGINLDIVECRQDEDAGICQTSKDGSIRWQSIDREKLEAGYRTVWNLRLPFQKTARSLAISGIDQAFIKGIGTTLFFTVFSVSLELLIALFMALTVNSDFFGRGLMRAVMLVPWAIPTVISARLWELILKDTTAGILNRVLMDIGLIDGPQAWLSAPALQLPAGIMVDVWKTAPFMALLLLAGLQTIPKDLYEAASVDGANVIQKFFSVTLPLLRPTIAVALVFRTLDALRVFDLFNVLFGRQQLSMATYNYETLVNNQQDGYASAISMIIFLLISIFAFMYVRLLNVETD